MRNPNPILIVSVVKDGASKVAILIFTDLIFYLKPLDTSLLVASFILSIIHTIFSLYNPIFLLLFSMPQNWFQVVPLALKRIRNFQSAYDHEVNS